MLQVLLLILVVPTTVLESSGSGNVLCVFSKNENMNMQKDSGKSNDSVEIHSVDGRSSNTTSAEYCSKESDSCYILWIEDPINKTITIYAQGCWGSSGDQSCYNNECISIKNPSKALNNSKFCCCSGNLCNLNITNHIPSTTTPYDANPAVESVGTAVYSNSTLIIAISSMFVFAVMAVSMFCLFRHCFHPPKRSKESLHLLESMATSATNFDFDSLKIQETIGCGRYGTVCKGTLHDSTVAVKVFSHQNKHYFLNEKDIYTLPFMEHPSVVKFIGSEERLNSESLLEHLLILSFSPAGCLQDFLRNSVVNWSNLCKMSLSIARGLAHLHTEFCKGDKLKPCVAHRDLTSRNILMKTDGTCMLCDFGFAIRICGSKFFHNGEEQYAETSSLADVGTLRYMAPEILEGAVNLRDCESSLKQIDVYALGLVIWEIATRCSDLFQGIDTPEYKLPFEAEVGLHPTMEQIQILVTRRKARPLFPDIWKDTNPAIRALKETIEECWDQDAEARLTSLCVEERLDELPVLWECFKAGLIPPCITSSKINIYDEKTPLHCDKSECFITTSLNGQCNCNNSTASMERTCSMSEGTAETTLSPSESGVKDISISNDKNIIASDNVLSPKVPLQPYQGYNPSLERNLLLESVNGVNVNKSTFLKSNAKYFADRNFFSHSDSDANIFYDPAMDSASMSSDTNHSINNCNSIPHLNIAAHSSPVMPKEINTICTDQSGKNTCSVAKDCKQQYAACFSEQKKKAKNCIRTGLKNFIGKKGNVTKKGILEEQQPLKNSAGALDVCDQRSENNTYDTCSSDEYKQNDHPVDTEIRIKANHMSTVVSHLNIKNSCNDERDVDTVDKLAKHTTDIAQAQEDGAVNNVQPNMQVEVKIPEKNKRPNFLPLKNVNDGQSELINSENLAYDLHVDTMTGTCTAPIRRKNSSRKRKGVKRVKTPFEIKSRFSLYDDRIMSSQELSRVYSKETLQPIFGETSKFSTSVPLDMNTLCLPHDADLTSESHESNFIGNKQEHVLSMPFPVNQVQVVHSLCNI